FGVGFECILRLYTISWDFPLLAVIRKIRITESSLKMWGHCISLVRFGQKKYHPTVVFFIMPAFGLGIP
ncbi:MAG: hypothetical protein WCG97_01505, partial [bacterium]